MEESSTSAVLEPVGAETTPEKSPISSEVSQSPKEGETKSAEKLPSEKDGKSSQQSPAADASDDDSEKDGVVNVHAHRRIKTERNELRTKLREFGELGIKSKDDLETLLRDADASEADAREKGVRDMTDWIVKTPDKFIADLQKNHPDVAFEIDRLRAPSVLYGVANWIRKTDAESAAWLEKLAAQFEGSAASGGGAPKDSGSDAVSKERNEIQSEKQQLFNEEAWGKYSDSLSAKVTELSKGLVFRNEKQRERFRDNVAKAVSESLYANPAFNRELARVRDVRSLTASQIRERVKEVAALHLKYAGDDLIRRHLEEEREVLGVSIAEKSPDKNGERREVNGGGAAPMGKGLTKDAKDRKYAEIVEQYGGGILAQQKYAEWIVAQRS